MELAEAIFSNNLEAILSQTPELLDHALHLAVKSDNNHTREILDKLIKLGADVNSTTDDGFTVLQRAVATGNFENVRYLMENGANVNATGSRNSTALLLAVTYGKREILKYLLENGAQVNQPTSSDNLLSLAIRLHNDDNCLEILQLLMAHGADLNGNYHISPLLTAAAMGNNKIVKFLMDRGAVITEGPLLVAVSSGHLETVKLLLLDGGFHVNSESLTEAIFRGNRQMVKLLLDHKAAEVDSELSGWVHLRFAVERGDRQIVQWLLERGANVNVESDDDGQTALTVAIDNGVEELWQLLIEHVVSLRAQKLFVSESNLNVGLTSARVVKDYWRACCDEIDLLTSEKFDDSSLSYFDICKVKDISKLAALASNGNIFKVLKSKDFLSKFPIYGQRIVDNFNRGISRNRDFVLIRRFFDYLSSRKIVKLPKLPFTFVCELFTCLNSNDVAKLRDL